MIDAWGLAEEELVRDAAECPPLSGDLRARILRAAGRAHHRRQQRRAAWGGSALLLAVIALVAWSFRTPSEDVGSGQQYAAAQESTSYTESLSHAELFAGPSDLMAMSAVGDWDHVEVLTRLRREHLKALLSAF